MSCGVAVPGACCRMICPGGLQPIGISANGNRRGFGNRSMPRCDANCAFLSAEKPNRAPPSLTVSRSKPVPFVVMSAGLTAGKKTLGRKRFLLVGTQGLVISAKVLTAHIDEREGGKVLLLPLVGKLPRLQVILA